MILVNAQAATKGRERVGELPCEWQLKRGISFHFDAAQLARARQLAVAALPQQLRGDAAQFVPRQAQRRQQMIASGAFAVESDDGGPIRCRPGGFQMAQNFQSETVVGRHQRRDVAARAQLSPDLRGQFAFPAFELFGAPSGGRLRRMKRQTVGFQTGLLHRRAPAVFALARPAQARMHPRRNVSAHKRDAPVPLAPTDAPSRARRRRRCRTKPNRSRARLLVRHRCERTAHRCRESATSKTARRRAASPYRKTPD